MIDDIGIDIKCACASKHCSGELLFYKGKNSYVCTVIDSGGNDEGSMYLSKEQIVELIDSLKEMIK